MSSGVVVCLSVSAPWEIGGAAAGGEAPAANGFPLEPPRPPGPGETYKMFGMPYSSEVGGARRNETTLSVWWQLGARVLLVVCCVVSTVEESSGYTLFRRRMVRTAHLALVWKDVIDPAGKKPPQCSFLSWF